MNPDKPHDEGMQDTSGMGLLGLVVGVLIAFAATFYLILPLFARNDSTFTITVTTVIAVILATLGGGLGYLLTRRKTRAARS